jgi:hypothetical protein
VYAQQPPEKGGQPVLQPVPLTVWEPEHGGSCETHVGIDIAIEARTPTGTIDK